MRKFTAIIALALFTLSACEEFQPVFTGKYDDPAPMKIYTEEEIAASADRLTIMQLKDIYKKQGKIDTIDDDWYIKGQVVSSDETGNFYKSFFIQDETSGIEIKLGKNNMCNEYHVNQWVYVKLKGLALGAYYGSIQVGYKDESNKYETSYVDVQRIIDTHVFKGEMGDVVAPKKITTADLSGAYAPACGTLVTLEDMTYANEIFCLVYLNPSLPSELKDKNHSAQRIFLSDGKNHGVTSWAMSETSFKNHLNSGEWDSLTNGTDTTSPEISGKTVKWLRENGYIVPSAYTVSQYFTFGTLKIGVRTSGYSKFCDEEIPAKIQSGSKCSMTGVLTWYSSSSEYQFTLLSLDGVKY